MASQPGSHWVCYYRNTSDRIHFDSYRQITPVEIQWYLKTGNEFARGEEIIQRKTDIIPASNTPVCGHLCLFVLKSLAGGEKFQKILNHMQHYGVNIHKVIGKIPLKPKRGFVLPKHRYTDPITPLHLQLDSKDQPLPREEPYNAVYVISMRHHICYRDNETGKPECDRKMLVELNALTPRGRREMVDRQLVRGIIGLKQNGNGHIEQSTSR